MTALGNDFVIINALQNKRQKRSFPAIAIRKLADRHFGIGADQILIIERAKQKNIDFHYRIFNADGTEAEQCINGVRCIAKYLFVKKISKKRALSLSCCAGITQVKIEKNQHITATVASPKIMKIKKIKLPQPVALLGAINTGNPHLILRVPNIKTAPLQIAPKISSNFNKGINIGFTEVISKHQIRLRTHERGTGETLACGSNATATVALGIMRGLLQSPVTAKFRFGSLLISQINKTAPVTITGEVKILFDGTFWL